LNLRERFASETILSIRHRLFQNKEPLPMRLSRLSFIVAGFALAAAAAVHADTITETFTAPDGLLGYAPPGSTSEIDQFNPSLGTLTSVTVAYTVGITGFCNSQMEIGCYVDFDLADAGAGYQAGRETVILPSPSFSLTFSGSQDNVDPATFTADFIGTGQFQFGVFGAVADASGGGYPAAGYINNLAGTVTYDYTPAAPAVPEPPSIALIGTGALMGAEMLRRQFSRS
jgi:hypothetical protein